MTSIQEEKTFDFSVFIVYGSSIIGAILGVIFILILIAAFSSLSLPYISDNFSAFVGLSIFGFAMCTSVFPIRASLKKDFSWLSPFTLLAILLGILAALEMIFVFANVNIPFLTSYPNAIIILAVIVFLKWLFATISLFVK